MTGRVGCSYVVPVRWASGRDRASLTAYLAELSLRCAEIIVVDGSPPDVFAANAAAWRPHARHVAPDSRSLNGKVAGVSTGFRLASNERVVIADDDVRYGPEELRRVVDLLGAYDLVRPQNFFDPLPWHARWDTARTLLNRATGADYPGTLAMRRSRFLAVGGYDGSVLFENLELIRSTRAGGGRVASPLDLFVRRLPPTTAHFMGQRVRQAYDDFALPARMCLWLGILPVAAWLAAAGRFRALAAAVFAPALLAERGRRLAGGSRVFPASSTALAPAWVAERAICAWLALAQRVMLGGTLYSGSRIAVAANPEARLRRRLAARG